MGTRGTWGFVLGEEEKLTYNHFDSYPDSLGADLVRWLETADLDVVREKVARLELVDSQDKPNEEQRAKLVEQGMADPGVSTGEDWYSYLRNCQGNPQLTLISGYMTDDHGFPADSLFCEWGYVIDLDANRFEVYRGFQTEPHEEGRFAHLPAREKSYAGQESYYPIRLIKTYELDSMPTVEEFIAEMEEIREGAEA